MLEGHDADEVNLLLDAEIQKIRLKKQAAAPKVRKCPSCGETIPALTGICPTCGYVLNTSDSRNHELDFLIEQMNRGLAQLKSGTANAPMVLATLDELRRKAMTLCGENQKVQALLQEIKQETEEYKRTEAEKQKVEAELKKMEAKAKLEAASNGSGFSNKGCQKGCLISFIIFMILGVIGMCMNSNNEARTDKQFEELSRQISAVKEEPITVENFEQKVYAIKDITWITHDEYNTYEKNKKEALQNVIDNYEEQLIEFYSSNAAEITQHYGHPISLNFSKKSRTTDDTDDTVGDDE